MNVIFAEYMYHNSIDVATTAGSECALNVLAIDEPLEYAKLYLDGNMQL